MTQKAKYKNEEKNSSNKGKNISTTKVVVFIAIALGFVFGITFSISLSGLKFSDFKDYFQKDDKAGILYDYKTSPSTSETVEYVTKKMSDASGEFSFKVPSTHTAESGTNQDGSGYAVFFNEELHYAIYVQDVTVNYGDWSDADIKDVLLVKNFAVSECYKKDLGNEKNAKLFLGSCTGFTTGEYGGLILFEQGDKSYMAFIGAGREIVTITDAVKDNIREYSIVFFNSLSMSESE